MPKLNSAENAFLERVNVLSLEYNTRGLILALPVVPLGKAIDDLTRDNGGLQSESLVLILEKLLQMRFYKQVGVFTKERYSFADIMSGKIDKTDVKNTFEMKLNAVFKCLFSQLTPRFCLPPFYLPDYAPPPMLVNTTSVATAETSRPITLPRQAFSGSTAQMLAASIPEASASQDATSAIHAISLRQEERQRSAKEQRGVDAGQDLARQDALNKLNVTLVRGAIESLEDDSSHMRRKGDLQEGYNVSFHTLEARGSSAAAAFKASSERYHQGLHPGASS